MPRFSSRTVLFLFAAFLFNCLIHEFGLRDAFAQTAGRVSVSAPVSPLKVAVDIRALQVRELPRMVTIPEGDPLPAGTPAPGTPIPDPVIQIRAGVQDPAGDAAGAPVVAVTGLLSNANPPDTVGDVGRNHYVQMVNATFFGVWNKQGAPLTGALSFGNLWPVGQTCRSNAGDPIVVYDHLADRWLLSQFASPSFLCIAISQTPDPTAGNWFLYTFDMGNFPDYPKFGVWPDGYYMTSYLGSTLGVYAFERSKMLVGEAATFVSSSIPSLGTANVRNTRILPADLDGPAPPAGTPNYFLRTVDSRQDPGFPVDRIEIYEFSVNFASGVFSFNLVDTLNPAPFDTMACNRTGGGFRDCVPQPATASTVDALSNRPMMQLKFRNFQTHFSMVVNQTIDVRGSMPFPVPDLDIAGIRWYELRKSAGPWAIFQQGTYAPQPSGITRSNQLLNRWMGSAAMDKFGNIALGFSIDNAIRDAMNPVFPGIRYVGHDFNAAPGVMGPEMTIFDGTNPQVGGSGRRWGDYSAMSVDPVDDCTFWFTTHVAGTGGTGPRPTRIASFLFDNCVSIAGEWTGFWSPTEKTCASPPHPPQSLTLSLAQTGSNVSGTLSGPGISTGNLSGQLTGNTLTMNIDYGLAPPDGILTADIAAGTLNGFIEEYPRPQGCSWKGPFTSSFQTQPPPAITSFFPAAGAIGTPVVITGTNFNGIANANIVRFNGVLASVTTSTTTTLTVIVPSGAVTGRITVTTAGGAATSSTNFTVN